MIKAEEGDGEIAVPSFEYQKADTHFLTRWALPATRYYIMQNTVQYFFLLELHWVPVELYLQSSMA
jgi:hypothetical protein